MSGESKRSKFAALAAACLVIWMPALAPCWGQATQPAPGDDPYVCPPCGMECDELSHAQAGTCPTCGMTLVRRSSLPKAELTKVAILVFEGVQIIDFTGPYEVFGQAGFRVDTVGPSSAPIKTAMGLTIVPEHDFSSAEQPDIVVVPGGNVETLLGNGPAADWLRRTAAQAQVVLSVCNGAFILARVGLLDGLEATTFASLIDDLAAEAPKTKVVSDRRFVDNGKIVTSAGLSSGIDAALHVVEKVLGRGRAQVIATNLEYNWDPESSYVRAALADRHLIELYRMARSAGGSIESYAGGTDRWENRWSFTDSARAQELVERIQSRLQQQASWSLIGSNTDNGVRRSEWSFRDGSGAAWSGAIQLQPAPEGGGSQLTLQVSRQ